MNATQPTPRFRVSDMPGWPWPDWAEVFHVKLDLDPDSWAPRKGGNAASSTRPLTYTEQTVMGRLRGVLQDRADKVAGTLTQGTLITIEQYREAVGELRGLTTAMTAILDAEREASGEGDAAEKKEPLYSV